MAHGTVQFFAPACDITVDSHWKFQDGGAKETTRERASELGADGDEVAHATHGARSTTSFIFIHDGDGDALVFPNPGTVSGGWHIDDFSVVWSRDAIAPKMTVNCHKHESGTNHSSGSCRTYTPSLVAIAPQTFGCPSAFSGGTGKNGFTLAQGAVVDLRDATYTVKCSHVDEANRTGGELAGNNYDGVETLEVNLTGEATSDDWTSDWDRVSDGVTPSNTGATATKLSFEHHLAHDTAS